MCLSFALALNRRRGEPWKRKYASELSEVTLTYANVNDPIQRELVMSKDTKQRKHDRAVDMTFPASDPVAQGKPTGTEKPRRPTDRQAPVITREQIEQARRGEGHKPRGKRP